MNQSQIDGLLHAHKHLLGRIAELEADAIISQTVLFRLADELISTGSDSSTINLGATTLVNAHKDLLERVAKLEASALVTREVLFQLADELLPPGKERHSTAFEKLLSTIQLQRQATADSQAGKLHDDIVG